ncbi:MAG TPA: hypothetical protein VKT77_10935 [Chthonomonadaceae bacterium]|nr:hypothetical protein [Chthonomonadaceae bacterium]
MTLIELLVALGLSGVVIIAVSGIFMGIQKQWSFSSTRARAVESGEMALDQVCSDIRNAISLQAVDGSKTNTFSLPNATDTAGNYVPARVSSTLQYVAGSRIHYYLSDSTGTAGSGTMLWRETNSAPSGNTGWTPDSTWSLVTTSGSKARYNNISNIAFSTSGLPSNIVQVSITILTTEGTQTYSLTLTRSVYLVDHN